MTSRVFDLDDQERFAKVSGDWNPLHVDAVAARRTQFGKPLVHGVHSLMWCLEQLLSDSEPLSIRRLSCAMRSPVRLHETVSARIVRRDNQSLKAVIESDEIIQNIKLEFAGWFDGGSIGESNPPKGTCKSRDTASLPGLRGSLDLTYERQSVGEMFPGLAKLLPPAQIALLLSSTRLVGMECPGLHSIYSELDLEFTSATVAGGRATLDWQVDTVDERFNLVSIEVHSEFGHGRIAAVIRPKPQEQPSIHSIHSSLDLGNKFQGRRALVIGGSRGLGELCAKLLAAGGSDVRLTYCRGQKDADKVVSEIRQFSPQALCFPFDATSPHQQLAPHIRADWFPTHVYYFATPHIQLGRKDHFSADLFACFSKYYVEGLHKCWCALREISKAQFEIYYPSTLWVSEFNPLMPEYAASKSAGENLCRFLESTDPHLTVKVSRLPRLPTDQTLGLGPDDMDDPLKALFTTI